VRDGPSGAASAEAPALPDLAEDEARLAAYASALADGVDAALPGWVEGAVARVLEGAGLAADGEVAERARRAGQAARVEVGSRVRDLLATDVDRQRANPLALLRTAVRYPTEVLRSVGAPPVARDAVAREQFPDDDYDLTPAGFADLHPDLHEPGLTWGAAKAHVVLRRRRLEGRR
jgi:hypothetical protein